ncbi:MAG TPA: hypothetical protein VFM64_02345 [Candidatus Nitrosotenuis sp.]|nr:hypothetical protein [Candidatus Nitrosotenuis sp.]
MGRSFTLLILAAVFLSVAFSTAHAATIKQTMDGSVDVTVTYPESIIAGRVFQVGFLVQNNGWEDKQDIKFAVSAPDNSFVSTNSTLGVDRLSKGGSYGGTIEFTASSNAQTGTHYLNALYSQVLLSNNETPTPPTKQNIAIPIILKDQPEIQLNTITPTAIFPNAEFPLDVEITSKDIDLKDISVEIVPPNDITFRGQSVHTYSSLQKNEPLQIHSQIVTTPADITKEHKLPFEIVVSYTDDEGIEKTTSKTISLLLRPRTFMEITSDGGIWIGGFFLAPYVSIGTIVGIPAGTLFSILVHRVIKKKNTKKKKNK